MIKTGLNLLKIAIVGIFVASAIFGSAALIHAQATEYELLAPIPQLEKGGGVTDTATYIPGAVKLLIAISTALAVLMIIYGGVKYMTTDAFSGKSEAKNVIWDAIWGLLLVIGAWTILYTINPKLLSFELAISQQGSATDISGSGISGPDITSGEGEVNFGGLSQQEALSQLRAANISFQGAPVLAGIKQSVVNEVIKLKNDCDCDVTVNSATGGKHAEGTCSHANGWKIDLDDTSSLNSYIAENFTDTKIVRSGDNARKWLSPRGVEYWKEGNHWDVALQCK